MRKNGLFDEEDARNANLIRRIRNEAVHAQVTPSDIEAIKAIRDTIQILEKLHNE